ncbi:right-handed parallel beta-helix repeat-containing protein [Pontiella desulfatans]|nr:right-handed parallel beta-helix repeat-containing protein [Pontiella desulfatans]
MDGTMILPAKWSRWKNGIYRMRLKEPVWQLFSGSKLVYVARWPNTSFDDGSIWRMEESMRFTDRTFAKGQFSGKTADGIISDRNPEPHSNGSDDEGVVKLKVKEHVNQTTLAETKTDFTGAVAVLNLGHWLTWSRPITQHKAGQDWFEYDQTGTRMSKYVAYYILGLPALDQPNEWWYDAESETAYFRAADDRNPNKLPISGKTRDFSLKISECSNLIFQGLEFFASTFSMTECSHVIIENSTLSYPSTHKFMLGEFGWFYETSNDPDDKRKQRYKSRANVMTHVLNEGEGPFGNIIRNCEIAYPNSPAIYIDSPGSILENCYIHNIEWDVNSSGGSGSIPTGRGAIIRGNTIHSGGNSEGIRPGPGSTVEYNRLWNMGNLQHDGSAINIGTGSQIGTVVRHNWVHDTNRQGIRFDSTTSRMGSEGCVHHNVVFNLGHGGSKFKGDHHLLFNNTFHDTVFAVPNGYGNTPPHNQNTLVCNTLADTMVAWSTRKPDEKLNARLEHNLTGAGSVVNNLRDPEHLDFRPKPGSPLIDAGFNITQLPGEHIQVQIPDYVGSAPDIGAYEANDETYWIPGRRQKRASTPIPPNKSMAIKSNADLMFLGAYKATKHIVNFMNAGKDHKGRVEVTASNIIDPGQLQPGQTYTWRVDAIMPDNSIIEGDIWTFTVESN